MTFLVFFWPSTQTEQALLPKLKPPITEILDLLRTECGLD